jgi:hypothetical protein
VFFAFLTLVVAAPSKAARAPMLAEWPDLLEAIQDAYEVPMEDRLHARKKPALKPKQAQTWPQGSLNFPVPRRAKPLRDAVTTINEQLKHKWPVWHEKMSAEEWIKVKETILGDESIMKKICKPSILHAIRYSPTHCRFRIINRRCRVETADRGIRRLSRVSKVCQTMAQRSRSPRKSKGKRLPEEARAAGVAVGCHRIVSFASLIIRLSEVTFPSSTQLLDHPR